MTMVDFTAKFTDMVFWTNYSTFKSGRQTEGSEPVTVAQFEASIDSIVRYESVRGQ